jgi:hypothetical protein
MVIFADGPFAVSWTRSGVSQPLKLGVATWFERWISPHKII